MKIKLEDHYKPLDRCGEVFYRLLNVRNVEKDYSLDSNPDFQREHVWTEEQQKRFVGHVLSGGDVAALLMNEGPGGKWETVLLMDGKQRYKAIKDWLEGKFKAILPGGHEYHISDVDEEAKATLSCTGIRFGLVRLNRKEMLDYYIRLNSAGTVHSESELERVKKLLENEK
jgi:hypothetical protein